MPQIRSEILYNQAQQDDYYKIALTCSQAFGAAVPGQFATLKIGERMDPLLRRPFSIHRLLHENGVVTGMEILYRVVGNFTGQLAEMKPSETIDLLGPLGHGFSLPAENATPVLAAGGIGVAPLVFLAESLNAAGIRMNHTAVFLGGRSDADILCIDDFSRLGMKVRVATEDGSAGEKGLVTAPLEAYLAEHRPGIIYACGPHGMLEAVYALAARHGIPCEVSIETVMACGLGICMGCAVKTADHPEGYRHICKDGPVFEASRVFF